MAARAGFAGFALGLALLAGCAAPPVKVVQTAAPAPSRLERGLVVATRPMDNATQTRAGTGIHAVMTALGLGGATMAPPAQEVVVQRTDGETVSFIAAPPEYAPGDHVLFAAGTQQRD